MSLGPAKVGLSNTDRSAPTYAHDIMYFRFPRKLLLKWRSLCEESPYRVVRFVAMLRRNSLPPRPSTHLTTELPPKCRNKILLHCMQTQRKRLPSGEVKFFPGLFCDIILFIISKVGAILAQIDVESLNALNITDLKNICNLRLCSFSCRKSNYMMAAGNRYLSFDFISITQEILNLKYTEDF
jgi:hypothetical protein